MRVKDVKLGEFYRVKGNEDYCWAQPIEILPPKTGINNTNAIMVKCRWVVHKNDKVGLNKYFRVSNLIKPKE